MRVSCLPDSRSHFNMAAFSSVAVLLYERKMCLIKSESMGAPGRCATCYLSDFNETWPV